MKEKVLGVIGGMGPKATAVFFDRVIEKTEAHKDQEHIDMIILNHASIPDRTQSILEHTEDEFLREVEKDIQLLEMANVGQIAIPCNTSHYFYDRMQEMTTVPIINMVEQTVSQIYELHGEGIKVGLLATNGTISSGVYEKECNKKGLNLYIPDEQMQKDVMSIIYDDVKGNQNTDPTRLEGIVKQLIEKEQCQCVILACTELSCIPIGEEITPYCIDAMEVLVDRVIERSGKKKINL
ncbi:amino acid racemase [Bacillaceae bacterium S4-13-56]